MIEIRDKTFYLQMRRSSYWFELTEHGHLRHLHYGPLLPIQDPTPLRLKYTQELSGLLIDPEDRLYSLDHLLLEYSSFGKGDFRESPLEIEWPDGRFNVDLSYAGYRHYRNSEPVSEEGDIPGDLSIDFLSLGLPAPDQEGAETLLIRLVDEFSLIAVDLIYLVYSDFDVIVRTTRVVNLGTEPFRILKQMSFMLDLPNRAFSHLTLHGLWGKEAHVSVAPLTVGTFSSGAETGTSSNQHNPGLMLLAGDESGYAYGLNIIYSGNHYTSVSLNSMNLCRVQQGLHPSRFKKTLSAGESFTVPLCIATFSDNFDNGVSQNFHDFINARLMPFAFREKPRPIVYNNWEATFFDFTEKKLLSLAKRAKSLGCELFMLDDGWFGSRDDDKRSLGDYHVNKKKFPRGLAPFYDKITGLGLEAGIWVEPEMISEDSDLYRAHPEYVLAEPGRTPATGRHQLVLDLCNPEVRDYLVKSLSELFDALPITYVKWDMNRNLSDVYSRVLGSQEDVYHQYVLGLYDVLRRVFTPRPHLMLEMCSSGGNRFDLGMLSFASLIWSSDDTDPIERLKIQEGLSYFYPPSAISNHVSSSPHQATFRTTPLSTRFNVASFGVLGYELDLDLLGPLEIKEIRDQIEFYKAHRELFQFGRFSRQKAVKKNKVIWQTVRDDRAVIGLFQTLGMALEPFDRLSVTGLEPDRFYVIETKPQRLFLERFGELIKHALPVKINPRGFAFAQLNKRYSLQDAVERYEASGKMLQHGILLKNQFLGSYYNEEVRMLGDFGSSLYTVMPLDSL